jgi:hypothetical protein
MLALGLGNHEMSSGDEMKSGKQRRAELQARREAKRAAAALVKPEPVPYGVAPVNVSLLAPDGSYSVPDFVSRGYYSDTPFQCRACGKEQIWTARQQKWWYEVAKGGRWTTASLCRPCRKRERMIKEAARRTHLEGIARKQASRRAPSAQD